MDGLIRLHEHESKTVAEVNEDEEHHCCKYLFYFLFEFAWLRLLCVPMTNHSGVSRVLILGHPFVCSLKRDLRAGFDARAAPDFGLHGAVIVRMHGAAVLYKK